MTEVDLDLYLHECGEPHPENEHQRVCAEVVRLAKLGLGSDLDHRALEAAHKHKKLLMEKIDALQAEVARLREALGFFLTYDEWKDRFSVQEQARSALELSPVKPAKIPPEEDESSPVQTESGDKNGI